MNMRRRDIRKMEYLIGNRYLGLKFDSDTGSFTEIINKITGDNYLKKEVQTNLYKLYCLSLTDQQKYELLPGKVKDVVTVTKNDRYTLSIRYENVLLESGSLEIEVQVDIDVYPDEKETLWSIKIDNQEKNYHIIEVLFPVLRGIYLGENWQDDVIIYPHHAGEKTVAPIKEYTTDRYLNFSRGQTNLDGQVYHREINYCGLASMSWMYYYDDSNGLYLASYDDDFLVTGLRVETGGPDYPWMGFGFRKYISIKPGESWQSNPYAVAVTTKDWHWGAQKYRKWIDNYIQMPVNPQYLEDEYVLNQCYQFKRNEVIYNRFEDIPRIYEDGRELFSARHLFIASWNRKGFDQDYPEYHPDIELGTPVDLYRGCQYVYQHDGFVTFYINARLFSKNSYYFERLGKELAIKDERGEMIEEQYGPHEFVVNCPANKKWQKYLYDMANWMVRAYQARGIYLDQLGSAEPFPCYDRNHSHKEHGEFNQGYIKLLQELLKEIRHQNPDTFLMIENCGDIYGSYVWGNLTWNGAPYDEYYNIFKYTFPEYTQVNMVNPPKTLTGEEREQEFYRKLHEATLLGSVFWIGLDKFDVKDKNLLEYLQQVIKFRGILNEFYKQGRYVDDESILSISSGLNVSCWELATDRLYVIDNLYSLEDRQLVIENNYSKDVSILYRDIEDNAGELAFIVDNDKIKISIPPAKLLYLLVKNCG